MRQVIDALSEPALLVDRSGAIVRANRAAVRRWGSELDGRALAELHQGERDEVERLIARSLGQAEPLVGALIIAEGDTPNRLPVRGSRVGSGDEAMVLLRVHETDDSRFRALSEKVAELHREIRERLRAEAVLSETLRERDLLFRELQHRVKNNMQMLAGMLLSAENEATNFEAKAALREASLRFSAVSAVQRLLYHSEAVETIDSAALLGLIASGCQPMSLDPVTIDLDLESLDLPNESATPLALIANELLTNAVKYGLPESGEPHIRVEFAADGNRNDDWAMLAITDNGPGFDGAQSLKRSSGLGLVRGLLRQLGGSLTIEQDGGARCICRFRLPAARARISEAS